MNIIISVVYPEVEIMFVSNCREKRKLEDLSTVLRA